MRWTALRECKCLHLIRHGFAVPPSPRRGKALGCSAVNFHAHFPLDAHILSRIAKRRKRMDRRFCGFTDHGDLDDLIFRDEEYEVSRR